MGTKYAEVMELVDKTDLESVAFGCESSSLSFGTKRSFSSMVERLPCKHEMWVRVPQ